MTSAKDSSVLFALDELRGHERRRVEEASSKTRERAEVARKQAEIAMQRRITAKKNADDLVLLRQELERAGADRVALERKVHYLEVASKQPMPQRTPSIEVVTQKTSHHLIWTTVLLVSCLGVFVATYSPESSLPSSVPEEPRLVATSDCPKTEVALPSDAAPTALVSIPEGVTAPEAQRSVRRERPKQPPRVPAPDIVIDDDCNGPLCGLPE